MGIQRTFAMIKPDAAAHTDAIIDIINANGFTITQRKRVRMTPEQASEFYGEHYGKPFFPSLIGFICSGHVTALVLAKDDAVSEWRKLIGPTDSNKARNEAPKSIRALYGTDGSRNAAHGSDSNGSAQREIRFFFPGSSVDQLPTAEATRDYLASSVNPTLIRGLTALCKAKPETPVEWLADWLLENNPNKPHVQEPED